MKRYRKEDLKKIGYYRNEEQLQERLKKLDWYCALECVIERVNTPTEKCFMIGKGDCEFTLSIQGFVHENEFLEIVSRDKLKKDYVSENEVSTYLSEQGYKVEKLFHVKQKNIKYVTNFDKFPERLILPNWIEERIEEPDIEVYQENFSWESIPYPFDFGRIRIYLTFKERIDNLILGYRVRVEFGKYIALMSNGRLKVFSEEQVKNID